MKHFLPILTLVSLLFTSCYQEVSRKKRPLVDHVQEIVKDIDANHRVKIVEDDFHEGDSIYKVRGYFMDQQLLKLVGVLHTSHIERDDYFYFQQGAPIFSGHLMVQRDDKMASEYKYYFDDDGTIAESLYWQDHYESGKRFPHERFQEYQPNMDSLHAAEFNRLRYFLSKLDVEGFEVQGENENVEANISR